MKLILKHNEQVRLYTDQLSYNRLFSFVEREFDIEREKIEMTFTDDEGDEITIASQQDISIVESYFNDKLYVKLTVKGPKKEKKQSLELEKNVQKTQKLEPPKEKKKKKTEKNKDQQKPKNQAKKEAKQKKNKKEKETKVNEKTVEIKELLNKTVSELVDQRLKVMIPCLREQLSRPAENKQIDNVHQIHENYECSQCLKAPIEGIRYECPTCQRFNLCSICENSNEHEHNLLKIKNPVLKPLIKKQFNTIDKLCKLLMQKTIQLTKKQQKKEEKKQIQKNLEKENINKAKRYLSQLFGNEPKFYNEFVKSHKKLYLEDIVKEYATSLSITYDQLKERVIDLQCNRLSKIFNKEAEIYKDFVREHFHFDLQTILKCIYDQQVEKKEKKKPKLKSSKVVQEKQEIKPQKMEKTVKIQMKQEVLSQAVTKSQIKAPQVQKQEKPKKQVSELKGGKQQILNLMIQFFGPTRREDYIRFISQHETHKKQDIVQMWADKFSVILP